MKTGLIVLACLAPILLLAATPLAVAGGGGNIHPFAYGTKTSYTSYPGEKIGCLTSGTYHTLKIDFYYTGSADNNQRITSLTLQIWDGSSWNPVSGTVTWEYSTDGEASWNSYSGTGDIDVPYSGKTGVGTLSTSDPHTTVKVKFFVTGSIGQTFYYRVHFTSYIYVNGAHGEPDCFPHPGNSGNHYFYYDICKEYTVPEFGEASIAALMAILVAFLYLRRQK